MSPPESPNNSTKKPPPFSPLGQISELSNFERMAILKMLQPFESDIANLLILELQLAIQQKKIKRNLVGWFSKIVENQKNGTFTSSLPVVVPNDNEAETKNKKRVSESYQFHDSQIREKIKGLPKGGVENLKIVRSLLKKGKS
ncbi:hypothetical protein ACO0LB_09245 [Undibacterium sp. SXout7W]|uniref:hypothetical protein n=1 Tax=Undibacterium sp. SXout7W TaxID=3413049 RepID=UPI003BEF5A00